MFLVSALVQRRLIPAGPAYLAHVKRAVHNLSFDEHDKHAEEERKRLEALHGVSTNGQDDLGVGDEEETEDLLSLDPKEWKVKTSPGLFISHGGGASLLLRIKLMDGSETRPLCRSRTFAI
jgi:hypothetical protein